MVEKFYVNRNKYWFEVREPKDDRGYSVGFGAGDVRDDNISKFNRTNMHEQFKIFKIVKYLFSTWLKNIKPENFYFSVPGEKRMRIYLNHLSDIEYDYEIKETDYKPFDLSENKVYYVIFKKKE